MKINIIKLVGMLSLGLLISSCGVMKTPLVKLGKVNVLLSPQNTSVPTVFKNLDKEISIDVTTNVPRNYPTIDYSNLSSKAQKLLPEVSYSQTITSFAKEATTDYMQKMRFDIASVGDYRLEINITEFNILYIDENSATAYITMTYRLVDNAGQTVISATQIRVTDNAITNTWGQLYWQALNQIDWDRIAKYLTVGYTPKDEKNAKVTGAGDTALEHTVIRWYVTSTPQGADVTWRVVSSTPDVANTNSNYIGTTPYESTESFDIRGLTYNNAGNVQIEVSCEKPGYLTQRKRFNLRQAIDQKEISAKFNLIKDE